jgi:plasmid maintenance system antidote protein VapI
LPIFCCMRKKIPIGELIYKKLNEERRSVAWLAEKISCNRSTVYKIFRKTFIDTELLLQISLILDYDFFSYYSHIFNENKVKK